MNMNRKLSVYKKSSEALESKNFFASELFFYFSFCSSKNFLASFIKLAVINTITIPIGKAAIMLTDCRLLMELSEKIREIGNTIKRIHQIS